MADNQQRCAHPGCQCMAQPGTRYCSTYCAEHDQPQRQPQQQAQGGSRQQSASGSHACGCGHPACQQSG